VNVPVVRSRSASGVTPSKSCTPTSKPLAAVTVSGVFPATVIRMADSHRRKLDGIRYKRRIWVQRVRKLDAAGSGRPDIGDGFGVRDGIAGVHRAGEPTPEMLTEGLALSRTRASMASTQAREARRTSRELRESMGGFTIRFGATPDRTGYASCEPREIKTEEMKACHHPPGDARRDPWSARPVSITLIAGENPSVALR